MIGKKTTSTVLIAMLIFGMALVGLGADPPLSPQLFVDPPTYTATALGEVFTININISNIPDLLGFEFKLGYNTTLLDVLGVYIGSFPQSTSWATTEIYESEGYVWVMAICMQAVEGNGTLATITFKATHAESGSCTLDLYDTGLYDSNAASVTHDVEDGNYEFVILDITVATDKPYYLPGENVEIHGNLTAPMDSSPGQGLVAIEVDHPNNYPIVVRTLQTGNTTPPGDIIIIEVVPCNQWGTPKDPPQYKRDATKVEDLFYVKVTVKNNSTETKAVTITANTYDGNIVPLGIGSAKRSNLSPGSTWSPPISVPIPEWASLGNAAVYANAFTDWPGRGFYGNRPQNGIPYCPEENATFEIINGGQGSTTLEIPNSENAQDYSLTFKLPTNAMDGIYGVYAISSYRGQSITSNTVFGVNAIYVSPTHYPTIQGAINAATPTNNSILVFPGTYNEHVIINKTVTLVGKDLSNTIINGSGAGTVVTVTANNVKISRFKIQNGGGSFPDSGIALNISSDSTISENTVLENYCGVYLDNSSQNNIIWGNTITTNNGYGINVHSSDNNEILGNTLSSNNYGVYLNHSTGTTLRDNNMICNNYNFGVFGDSLSDFTHDIDTSNTVDGKPIYYWINQHDKQVPTNAGFVAIVSSTGIAVRGLDLTKNCQGVLFAFTNDSLIERVNTARNKYGITLVNSYRNTIIGSAVSNNTVGIYQRYSDENSICHNNFINNTNQVDLYQSSNTWDDGDGNGTYWSDYTGEDLDGDGVGDTLLPHQGVDWYPLMNPWVLVHNVAATNVTNTIPYNGSQLYPGMLTDVTVTVKNEGDFTETFHIIAYYAGNPIGMKQIIGLTPQKETASDLTWDTTGVSPGNYTLSANASEVFGETYLDDNAFVGGNVTVLEPTEHDVAVTSVTPSAPKVNIRDEVNVIVVAKNEGHFTQTFNVTTYYANATIDTKSVTLRPLADTTLIFTWNTTGVALGNYTISAEATVVPGETNMSNNILTDGMVEVFLLGDVNGDGVVDGLDKIIVGIALFTVPGMPLWNPDADVNEDGMVDGLDKIIVGIHLWETAW